MFDVEKTKQELIEWIKKTVGDCTVVIGISGGVDSSVCAALCVEALGKDKVFGVLMPDGEQHDIDKSHQLCDCLGISNTTINIHRATVGLRTAIWQTSVSHSRNNIFEKEARKQLLTIRRDGKQERFNDVYETNTPARIRMATLYGVAAILGNSRVANTCNLSEDWVGYSTKFGDSAGDFSPLANITKTEVRKLGYALELPKVLNDKEAIDGMSKTILPDGKVHYLTDEEKLGFTYEELDKYIRTGNIENLEHKEKIDRMHKANLHKVEPMPKYKPEDLEVAI